MKLILIACAITLTFMACGNSSSSKKRVPTADEQIVEKQTEPIAVLLDDNPARLAAIRRIIDSIGFVDLPYRLNCEHEPKYIIPEAERELNMGDIVHGILPDTSIFFGFVSELSGQRMHAQFYTFDKSGKLINTDVLMSCSCPDLVLEEIYCDEHIIIQEDMSLYHTHKSKFVTAPDDFEQCDTISEHFEKKGRINANGTVVFGEEVIYD